MIQSLFHREIKTIPNHRYLLEIDYIEQRNKKLFRITDIYQIIRNQQNLKTCTLKQFIFLNFGYNFYTEIRQRMNQLSLLRDYVTTMEKQLQSKNRQLKTLTEENKKLIRQNQQFSMKKSYVSTLNSICDQCTKTKREFYDIQSLCSQLQTKYDNLQRQKNLDSLSSVRVISTACNQCSRVKSQLQQLKIKYENVQRSQSNRISGNTYSALSCSQCPRLRSEIQAKNEAVNSLRSQISSYNMKILTSEGQVNTLNATMPKPVVYTQTVSRPKDLQRIAYLNNQVEQYLALVNSLRSQIKVLNQQNQRYIFRIRDLESRPREVQYIEKELSSQIRQQMRSLRIQVGELSNDNILLRRQNAALKRQIMSLPKSSHVIVESGVKQKPPRSSSTIIYYEDRQGRHFRKSHIGNQNNASEIQMQKMPYPQKVRYDDLQRRIQMLQMENDYLKGTFYSQI